jgi:XTP/dITP diphosphohydrolase
MRIVLASSNSGKIKEISAFLDCEVIPYTDLIEKFHIEEDGNSFKENSEIKAKSVYEKLKEFGFDEIVMADDSGISIEVLNWEPNIYSSRYAGENASDADNLQKVITEMRKKGATESKAFYTAAISVLGRGHIYTTHGWMYGKVIDTPKGENGFGYDPIFVPNGYKNTVAELSPQIKQQISHRTMALKNAKKILKIFR